MNVKLDGAMPFSATSASLYLFRRGLCFCFFVMVLMLASLNCRDEANLSDFLSTRLGYYLGLAFGANRWPQLVLTEHKDRRRKPLTHTLPVVPSLFRLAVL